MEATVGPLKAQLDAENEGAFTREGDGWTGRLEGHAPVQGYGTIDGLHWYFRGRWDGWNFGIGHDQDSAVDRALFVVDGSYGTSGMDASWMPYREAWELIEKAIATYRSPVGNGVEPHEGEA